MQKLSSDLFINAYGNSSTSGTEQDSDMEIASKNVFTDIGCTIKAPMQTIYVNGTKVGPKGAKVDYKTTVLYSDIQPSLITVISKTGKTSTRKGKIAAGVTMSSDVPTLIKGKIVDKEAANIAKVSYSKGKMTITAKKDSGVVYAWLCDTGDDGGYAYVKIDINMAPTKMILQTDELAQQNKTLNKLTLSLGSIKEFNLKPTYDKLGTVTKDATYTAASNDYSTTDACKVAKIASADGFSYNSKGNLIVSKPSGDAAKVQIRYEKNNSRIKITLPKKLNGGTTAYFIVSYSANAYKVYQISMS